LINDSADNEGAREKVVATTTTMGFNYE